MAYTPEQFATLLLKAAADAPQETVGVVRKGSLNVKEQAQQNVLQTAPVHNAGAHRAIDFDIDGPGLRVSSEIGYNKAKRGGPLGNLLEFGGGGDHSPPHHDLSRALDAEEPRFERALGDMGERLLGDQ